MRYLVMLWLLCYSLYGGTGWEKLAEPAYSPSIPTEGVVDGVNVITGVYVEHAVDLVTQGIDPYVVERCYCRESLRP